MKTYSIFEKLMFGFGNFDVLIFIIFNTSECILTGIPKNAFFSIETGKFELGGPLVHFDERSTYLEFTARVLSLETKYKDHDITITHF